MPVLQLIVDARTVQFLISEAVSEQTSLEKGTDFFRALSRVAGALVAATGLFSVYGPEV